MKFGLSFRAKQVIGVTFIVALAIAALTSAYLALMVRVWLTETEARGEMVAKTAYQRAFAVAAEDRSGDLGTALRDDAGLRSILEAALYGKSITFATLVDAKGTIIMHSDPDPALVARPLAPGPRLSDLIAASPIDQARAIFTPGGGTYEVAQPLLISGGGEFGSIRVGVSTLLIRGQIEDAAATLERPVAAVLIVTVLVAMLLANLILRPIAVISSNVVKLGRGEFDAGVGLPDDAEFRDVSDSIKAIGARLAASGSDDARQLVALSRLSAGIAHEIKNPLNAMSIHLELLRGQIGSSREGAEHLSVIIGQLRRLDDVVQTFLKFSRPERLALTPTSLVTLFGNLAPIVEAEAEPAGVRVTIVTSPNLPDVRADESALQNALLNLSLNAVQAMPSGGTLRINAAPVTGGRVEITISDTGVGIPADQLDQIFNLYYTTKEGGSGIGLAMVFRTVQLHDGEINVESAAGRGTTFKILLWRAEKPSTAS